MDIIIGKKAPVQDEARKANTLMRYGVGKVASRKDLRKNKTDRRKGVRDGVIVSLSCKSDRRKSSGRRDTDCCVCL